VVVLNWLFHQNHFPDLKETAHIQLVKKICGGKRFPFLLNRLKRNHRGVDPE